ncbi:MAG: ABC transporter permease [Gemmatimonadetes bacterium]|nr:ABC transporter permease [Gemmatimonadota bacterium]
MRPLLIAALELKRYVRDRGQLGFSLLLPVALVAVMVGAFGGQAAFRGTATVVDLDATDSSRGLLDRIEAAEGLKLELVDEAKANRWLDGSARLMVTVIPAGFGAALADPTTRPAVEFRMRGNGGQEGQVVASIVRGLVDEMASEAAVRHRVERAMEGSGVPAQAIREAVERALQAEAAGPVVGVAEAETESGNDAINLFFPGIITMIAMFAVTMNAGAMVEERNLGTLERILTTRISAGGLFLGKFLANFARGCLQMLILVTLGWVAFRSFGPAAYAEALVVAALLVACAGAVGVLIAGVARTPDQATWAGVTVTMMMAVFGGSFFEIPQSGIFRTISYLTVNRYGNLPLQGIVGQGHHLGAYVTELAALAGIAGAVLLLARPLFAALRTGKG